MLDRCRNPKNRAYKNYGGRGIAVCARWQKFENFLADMGERPDGMALERIDNDLGYGPLNCEWATRAKQNANRRNCIFVPDGDEKVTLKEYCRRYGMPYRPVVKRIKDLGWPADIAITAPMGSRLAALL